ncbi:MAG: hypothetical protein COA63_014315 [Methylophaga sp.]|nr:hypothetical protein [Methylophaga sp.]
MAKIIIVDIDGTIANMQKDEPGKRGPYDWDRVGEDLPHKDIIQLVKMFHYSSHKIVFMTGRDESCRAITKRWLIKYLGFIGQQAPLYMRPEGDRTPDTDMKLKTLQQHLKDHPKDEIYMAIDDRNSVVKLWRDEGIRCLQVAEGNF